MNTCPTWCIGGPGHDDNDKKVCCSETHETMLITEEPSLDWSGTQAASADLHAEQETGKTTYFLTLGSGDDTLDARLTGQELEGLRDAATRLLDEAGMND